jgi:predicted PurR-regulated permease PerM
MKEKIELNISFWTIAKVILAGLLIYALFLIRDILALLFIVLILVASFSPVVESWSKVVGRTLSVIAIVVIFVGLLALGIYIVVPPMVGQIAELTRALPGQFSRYDIIRSHLPSLQGSLSVITNSVGNVASGVITITSSVVSGVIAFIAALVIFAYFLIDEKAMKYFVLSLFPDNHRENMAQVMRKIAKKVGDWFRGQILLAIIVGVIDLVGLIIIGVPYALTLAVVSGVLEIVPTLGPIIAGLAAAIVALTVSPWKALIVIVFYIAVQQLENNVIVPKVMQKALGLSPVIIIVAILIGAKLMGIIGAVIAVPLAASLTVVLSEWSTIRKYITPNE